MTTLTGAKCRKTFRVSSWPRGWRFHADYLSRRTLAELLVDEAQFAEAAAEYAELVDLSEKRWGKESEYWVKMRRALADAQTKAALEE